MFAEIVEFRQKLAQGATLLGAGITLAEPAIVEALAPLVDFVWIDMEHTHLDFRSVHAHLLAARAGRVAALVRVRSSDVAQIKPVLDFGAPGVIVPQIRSAAEARRVVANCRYAPQGERGYGPRRPADYGRAGGPQWMADMNRQLFVAVQVENCAALAEVDEIAAIDGLDSLCLGPFDLSIALGRPGDIEHPEVRAALERIVRAARAAGKFIGTGMGAYAAGAVAAARLGVQWIQCGDDYGYMTAAAERLLGEVRASSAACAAGPPRSG